MSEEKKGRVRITMEIEVNEELMSLAKEMGASLPEMMAKMRRNREES